MKAKYDELEKLKNSEPLTVEDTGQNHISTRWIFWYKGEDIRAPLVARGFEEEANSRRDFPTVGRNAVRILLAISASKNWSVRTICFSARTSAKT